MEYWRLKDEDLIAAGDRGRVRDNLAKLRAQLDEEVPPKSGRWQGGCGRSPSTISRELDRNAPARGGYRATVAQLHAERRARRPKTDLLLATWKLRDFGKSGSPARSGGRAARRCHGPAVQGMEGPQQAAP